MNVKNPFVTFCLLLWAAVRVGVAGPVDTYVPLRVGNTWTYVGDDQSTREFTIVGRREIHGNTYYHFDDYYTPCCFPGYSDSADTLLRYDPDLHKLLQYDSSSGEELVRYDFSENVWGSCGNQLTGTDIHCTVPAGEFDDCVQFDYAIYVDCGVFQETLAPEVGAVAFFSNWDGHFELQSYTIVPEPSDLVAICSMGAAASACGVRRRRKPRPRAR